jgi:hypothetical protein
MLSFPKRKGQVDRKDEWERKEEKKKANERKHTPSVTCVGGQCQHAYNRHVEINSYPVICEKKKIYITKKERNQSGK